MLPPRRSPDHVADHAKIDNLVTTLRREAGQAEADPFDDAMVAAAADRAEATKVQAVDLAELRRRTIRLARRVA